MNPEEVLEGLWKWIGECPEKETLAESLGLEEDQIPEIQARLAGIMADTSLKTLSKALKRIIEEAESPGEVFINWSILMNHQKI